MHDIVKGTGKPNFLGGSLARSPQRLLGSAAVIAVAVWLSP